MRYQVKDPQGNLHEIEGPDGATPEEVLSAAQSTIPKSSPAPLGSTVGSSGQLSDKFSVGDTLRSAFSGIPYGAISAATAPIKAEMWLGKKLGFNTDPYASEVNRKEQAFLGDTGGNYQPTSQWGERAKAVTSAAVPIPGFGSLPMQMGLGAASGALGQATSEVAGPTAGAAASMVPFLGYAGLGALRPGAAAAKTRAAYDALLPQETATMDARLAAAKANNLPLAPWQAAPAGSEIRALGERVASNPNSIPVRSMQGDQALKITGNEALIPPVAPVTARVSSPMYQRSAQVPIDVPTVEAISQKILDIIPAHNLAPNGPAASAVKDFASQFGESKILPPSQATINQWTQAVATLPANNPTRIAAAQNLNNLYRGIGVKQFVPNDITNFGHVQNIYQDLKTRDPTLGTNLNDQTKNWIKKAISDVADPINPLFPAARKKHGELSDLIKAVEETDKRGSQALDVAQAARTSLTSDAALALGANPIWAMVPLTRQMAVKKLMKQYNAGFGSTDPQALIDLMNTRPLTTASQGLLGSLMQPVKQPD